MSEIKAGDLVMIVRPKPCCGLASCMGLVGVAKAAPNYVKGIYCIECKFIDHNLSDYFLLDKGYVHLSRLKKIDPPALDEEVERVVELETA